MQKGTEIFQLPLREC